MDARAEGDPDRERWFLDGERWFLDGERWFLDPFLTGDRDRE